MKYDNSIPADFCLARGKICFAQLRTGFNQWFLKGEITPAVLGERLFSDRRRFPPQAVTALLEQGGEILCRYWDPERDRRFTVSRAFVRDLFTEEDG